MERDDKYNPCRDMALPAVPLAPGLSYIDLEFLGRSRAIAAAVVFGPGGVAIVDPGPTRCLPALEAALAGLGTSLADVTDVLLTHIHLDHAGATGTIVQRQPRARVWVHERGAPHLVDPRTLVESATRLYGADMDRLWGDVLPVAGDQVTVLRGGERFVAGGRAFDVAYTPGHAVHHVSYFERGSGVAFAGDVAGVRIDHGFVLAPTPPPDIDVDRWHESVARLEAWSPDTLFLTHFGPATDVRPHLQALLENLDRCAAWVKASLSAYGSDEERGAAYSAWLAQELRRQMPESQLSSYRLAARPEGLWLGLARYWRKRGA